MTEKMLPLLRPSLPRAELLLPYLQQIDQNAIYTNFGPLNQSLIARLTSLQRDCFGRQVFGITTSSATLALELMLADLNLPPASRILLPSLTFVATATAILRAGHIPVVADVDPESWLLTPSSLSTNISLQTISAVIPVATFGMPQCAESWASWSEQTGIPVIIDAAGAFGAQKTSNNVPVIFSLHATKCLSTGEGGLIFTEDPEQAANLINLTNFGLGGATTGGGTNAKMSEYHAAVGHAELDAWPQNKIRRLSLFNNYRSILTSKFGDGLGYQKDTGLTAPNMFLVRFNSHQERLKAEKACANNGILTRRWYQPLIQNHPSLMRVESPQPTPHANKLADRLLGLPFYLDLTKEDIHRISKALNL